MWVVFLYRSGNADSDGLFGHIMSEIKKNSLREEPHQKIGATPIEVDGVFLCPSMFVVDLTRD